MKTFIVIPTYNEAGNLGRLIKQIFTILPETNILVVDDNSPDGTGKIASELSRNDSRVHVIHNPKKAGLGKAYIQGFKKALAEGADLIFEIDADFSHDPNYLSQFVKAAQKYDLVIGSRYINGVRVEGWRFRRLLLSKLANIFVSYIVVRPIWDFTAGYRCYRRSVLESIDLDSIKSDGYAFQIEMTCATFKHGFKVGEIPILFKERSIGYSKISKHVIWEAFWITFRCRASVTEIIKHLSFLFKDYTEFVEKNALGRNE